jgi:ATP-binding cassette, subfamily B, bacterial PglK
MSAKNTWIEAYKKIFNLLNRKQQIRLFWILLLMIIGAVLEMLGIGIIIPAINFFENSQHISEYSYLFQGVSVDGLSNEQLAIIIFIGLFFIIYLLKNLFIAFMLWHQSKFTFNLIRFISLRLFTGYLNQSYDFHLQKNSSELIRNVIGEVSMFNGVLKSSMLIMTEVIVVIGIVSLLIYVDPFSTLLVGFIFTLSGWVFNKITSSYTLKWGKERQFHEGLRIQHVNQGLGGIKEIKLARKEPEFIDVFRVHNARAADVGRKQQFLENIPRLWIELLVILILSLLIVVLTLLGNGFSEIAPTIIIFAMAAFRLMPSVNRIIGGVQRINYSIPIVNMINMEFSIVQAREKLKSEMQNNNFNKLDADWNSINFEDIFYKYPNTNQEILNKVSLKIVRNSSIGIIGESGSGKSTLINILLGLLHPISGDIKIDEISIFEDLQNWQEKIGYVPQNIFLTDDTVRNNIAFGLKEDEISDEQINRAIQLSQLTQFIDTLEEKENTHVGEDGIRISGGQKQRIGIARALYHNPEILILDEATSSLDFKTESEIMEDINFMHGQKTIIIVTHRLTTISKCDNIFKMENNTLNKLEKV